MRNLLYRKLFFLSITVLMGLGFNAGSYGRTFVYVSSSETEPLAAGQQMHVNIQIAGGRNVSGYELTIGFDPTSLRYIKGANADYLSEEVFIIPPIVSDNTIYIAATSQAGIVTRGEGTLATLTFEVIAVKRSTLKLMNVILSNSIGTSLVVATIDGQIVTTQLPVSWDVNEDGKVNILDLTLVANKIGIAVPVNSRVDVNQDGDVNILDLVQVAQHLDALGNRKNNPEVRVILEKTTPPGIISIGPREIVVLQGKVTNDRTLSASYEYLLRGAVFVESGAMLTIEPGVKILGERSTNGTLVVTQGSKIMANGTVDSPIVMTSDAVIGSRARGQWGGLTINGRAPTNQGISRGEGDTGTFGGNNPDDSSGVLRYVRIEFAGIEFSPDNELNGLSLQGVGSGTIIEKVQVHMSQDDGIEMFGGTVNLKYALVTGARDDSFDWTDGWTGKGQFWVAQQYGDDADNGFENDNSSKNNEAIPRSAPTIYNVTLVGDPVGPESDNGMLIREGAAGTYANFIVTGFKKIGLDITDESTYQQANDGKLVIKNSIFFSNSKANFGDERNDDGFDEAAWAKNLNNYERNPNLVAPFSKSSPDFTPGAGAASVVPITPPSDDFFETVNFIGGVSSSNNWTIGWTTTARN